MKPGPALLPLLLGGCDILFELRPVPSPDGGSMDSDSGGRAVDAESTSDAFAGCAFVDNFDDNILSPSWQLIDSAQTAIPVTETGGQLVISPQDSANGDNGVITAMFHDMRNMALTVMVSPASELGGVQTGVYIGPDTNNYASIETGGNNVSLHVMTSSMMQGSNNSYDPANRWWRIRHSTSTGMIYFSFSADGSTFTSEIPYNMAFSMAAVNFSMAVIVTGQNAPGQAQFDNFTICPGP